MKLKDWRKANKKKREEGVPLELPSGLTVHVRSINTADFFRFGRIPDSLSSLVAEMISGKQPDLEKVGLDKSLIAMDEMMNAICRLAIVSPKIIDESQADEPGDDELLISELDEEDKEVIRKLLGLPARLLEPFCEEASRDVVALRNVKSVESSSESSDESASVVS